jgi:hypothetical protein
MESLEMTVSKRSLALWVWTLPLVFALHDGEEIITMAAFLQSHANRLPAQLMKFTTNSTGQFLISVLFLLVLILVFCFLAKYSNYSGLPMKLFALLIAILLGNGLTHLGQAALLHDYTPGLLTAPFVIIFTIFALDSFWGNGFITRRNLFPMLAGGFVLQIPLVALALAFGRMFNL